MSRHIKKVLAELTDAKTRSEVNLDAVKYSLRAGQAIAKQEALNKLEALRNEYRQELEPRVATIFAFGTPEAQLAFAAGAQEEGGTLTVDTQEIYKLMAADVELTMGRGRQFGSTQVNHMIRTMEELGRRAGLSHMVVPRLTEVLTVKDVDAMAAVVKNIILTQVGEQFNARYIMSKILNMALEAGYGEKVLPIVMTGATIEEAAFLQKAIFSGKGIKVSLDDDLNPEVVGKAVLQSFAALKEVMKSNPQ